MNSRPLKNKKLGFTLIELLVVLAIVALLMTLAAPRYFRSLERSKETILLENLHLVREVIDRYYGDTGRYPESIEDLVDRRYLRSLPFDPVTESFSTWIVIPPSNSANGKVFDVKSGADGFAQDGRSFKDL